MKKLTFQGNDVTILQEQVVVGDVAPDFQVCGLEFNDIKLSDFHGKTVVITVFPSIDTSVCALQTIRFNKEAANLSKDIVMLTVSVDLPPALSRFCAGEGIENLITTSDYKTKDFALKYGYLVDELQLLARGTVVVGKDGLIKYVEHVAEVTQEPDYEATLKVIKEVM